MTSLCDKQLKRWYRRFNRLYFDGRLEDVDIFYAPTNGCCGQADEDENGERIIVIDPCFALDTCQGRIAVLHEMKHLSLFPHRKHGKRFDAETARLFGLGAYKGLL